MEQRDDDSYMSEISEEQENDELDQMIDDQDLIDFDDEINEYSGQDDLIIEEEIEEEFEDEAEQEEIIEDQNKIKNETLKKKEIQPLKTVYKNLRMNFFDKFLKLFFK